MAKASNEPRRSTRPQKPVVPFTPSSSIGSVLGRIKAKVTEKLTPQRLKNTQKQRKHYVSVSSDDEGEEPQFLSLNNSHVSEDIPTFTNSISDSLLNGCASTPTFTNSVSDKSIIEAAMITQHSRCNSTSTAHIKANVVNNKSTSPSVSCSFSDSISDSTLLKAGAVTHEIKTSTQCNLNDNSTVSSPDVPELPTTRPSQSFSLPSPKLLDALMLTPLSSSQVKQTDQHDDVRELKYPSVSQVMDSLDSTQPNTTVAILKNRLADLQRDYDALQKVLVKKDKEVCDLIQSNRKQNIVNRFEAEPVVSQTGICQDKVNSKITVNTATGKVVQVNSKVLYFRSQYDKLSPFYPSLISTDSGDYPTSEHLYQATKATHLGRTKIAERIRRAKTPAEAKKLAKQKLNGLVANSDWNEVKKEVMLEIQRLKFQQCKDFRVALNESKDFELYHNMETDEEWGIGRNGTGKNLMGVILMELRDFMAKNPDQDPDKTLPQRPNLPLSAQAAETGPKQAPLLSSHKSNTSHTTEAQSQVHKKVSDIPSRKSHMGNLYANSNATGSRPDQESKLKKTVVYGDSMIRDLNRYTNENYQINCFPGKGMDLIHMELLRDIPDLRSTSVENIIIHAGTNDMERTSAEDFQDSVTHILADLQWHLPSTKVIISGIIHRLDRPFLNAKIDKVNAYMEDLADEQTIFINHNESMPNIGKFVNSKGLHLKANGLRKLAENLSLSFRLSKPDRGVPRDKRQKPYRSVLSRDNSRSRSPNRDNSSSRMRNVSGPRTWQTRRSRPNRSSRSNTPNNQGTRAGQTSFDSRSTTDIMEPPSDNFMLTSQHTVPPSTVPAPQMGPAAASWSHTTVPQYVSSPAPQQYVSSPAWSHNTVPQHVSSPALQQYVSSPAPQQYVSSPVPQQYVSSPAPQQAVDRVLPQTSNDRYSFTRPVAYSEHNEQNIPISYGERIYPTWCHSFPSMPYSTHQPIHSVGWH